MKNRRITAALSLILVVALIVGCSPSTPADPQASTAPAQSQQPAASTAPEATDAGEQQQAASGDPVKIGCILPLSSAAATSGTRVKNGIEIGVAEINENGGVLGGRPLEVIFEDMQASDPALALSAAEKLIHQDNVIAIIGCYSSTASLAVLPVCEQNGLIMFETNATSAAITSGSEWVFRISSTNTIDAEMVGAYLPKVGFNKIAYMPVDNDWGLSVVNSYVPALEAAGAETILTEPIAIGETNYLSQLTKIKNSDADSIIITQDHETLAILLKQMVEAGMTDYAVLSTSGNSGSITYSLAGEAAVGTYFTEYYAELGMVGGGDSPENVAFTEAFKAKFPNTPADYNVIQGMTAAHILAEAIDRAGNDDRTALRDAMRETKYQSMRGLIEFDEFGQAHAPIILTQLREGGEVHVIDYTK